MTRSAVSVFAAVGLADFLHVVYAQAQQRQEPPELRAEDAAGPAGLAHRPRSHRQEGVTMSVDKAQVVEILRARGDHDLADRVNLELPASFDPSQVELLEGLDLGVDPGDAQRHAGVGKTEEMNRIPESGSSPATD
jgi:hypothetical protein